MATIDVAHTTTAAELQALIDNAARGDTISLGAGTFHFDRTVVIERNDISVVGQGPDQTHILVDGQDHGFSAFRIGEPLCRPQLSGDYHISQSVAEGGKSLLLKDAGGITAGDHLWIEMPNTDHFRQQIGDTQWDQNSPLRTSMVEVASVHGGAVKLTNGLAFDFYPSLATVHKIATTEHVKLAGFSVDYGLGASDPSDFSNPLHGFNRVAAIELASTSHVYLKDINLIEPGSIGFNFGKSIYVHASNLSVNGAHDKGTGGNGYAFQLRDVYDSELSHLNAHDTRHGVLFASWTSAANNTVEVDSTNRDINFHGGRDHNNVVTVHDSLRTSTEAGYLGKPYFINADGTHYGAPTDPAANHVSFGDVAATNKSETIVAGDTGSTIHARGGDDVIAGGAGNDHIDGGSGNDAIKGSAGNDVISGDYGTDSVTYHGNAQDYRIGIDPHGDLVVIKPHGFDQLSGIDALRFADKSLYPSGMHDLPVTHVGTSHHDLITVTHTSDLVIGNGGWDRVVSDVSFTLRDAYGGTQHDGLGGLTLTGTANINGSGNAMNNSLMGNSGENTLKGLNGDDRILGRAGSDHLLGNNGDDRLFGQTGNDILHGGNGDDVLNGGQGNDSLVGGRGNDTMIGGWGADTFHFAHGTDTVTDFSVSQGDRLAFSDLGLDAAQVKGALEHAGSGEPTTLQSLGIDAAQTYHDGTPVLHLTFTDTAGDVGALNLDGVKAATLLAHDHWMV